MMAGIERISEVVYYRVNEIIGRREEVAMRRDIWDIMDFMWNYMEKNPDVLFASGSMREGFDMKGSDFDFMIWKRHTHVICDLSHASLYNLCRDQIILMEDQFTRPGFVLLRPLKFICTCNFCRDELCMRVNNQIYISSCKFRRHIFETNHLDNATVHGPCTSGFINGYEYDFGPCFASKHWPPQAFCWIGRCKRKGWPSSSVLRNIIQSGCHFMAIGAKNSPCESLEWRLSFSQAEQKLIYSMNHVQFLVYGQLKLFLKEVLHYGISDEKKLLCSYFLKTAVFWEVQDNVTNQWTMNNFLFYFWKCYKHLMNWVYHEYCPNFFVPQNNMFYPKITGPHQQQLFCQMLELYNEGFQCLLRCSSIRDQLYSALIYPQHLMINTGYISEFEHDSFLFYNVYKTVSVLSNEMLQKSVLTDNVISFLAKLKSNISQTQRIACYKYTVQTCQLLAVLLQCNQGQENNTQMYRSKKQGLRLMEVTSKRGCVSDPLYLVIYLYNDGRYRDCLSLLQKVQSKLYRDYVVFNYVPVYQYLRAVGGQSISTKIKLALAINILIPYYTNFQELWLELRVLVQKGKSILLVSPFVLLHFLSFLSHYHLGNSAHKQQSLHDLHTLVYRDDDRYMCEITKDIAWEMLGICHQLNKDPCQALQCYWKVLQGHSPINRIQQWYRIQAVKQEIYLNQQLHS